MIFEHGGIFINNRTTDLFAFSFNKYIPQPLGLDLLACQSIHLKYLVVSEERQYPVLKVSLFSFASIARRPKARMRYSMQLKPALSGSEMCSIDECDLLWQGGCYLRELIRKMSVLFVLFCPPPPYCPLSDTLLPTTAEVKGLYKKYAGLE